MERIREWGKTKMQRVNSKPIRFSPKTKLLLVWQGIKKFLIFVLIFVIVQTIFMVLALSVFGEEFFDHSVRRFILFFSSFAVTMVIDEIRQQIVAVNKREQDIIEIWVELKDKKKG